MNQTGIMSFVVAIGCHAVVLLGLKLPTQNQTPPKEKVYLEVSLAASIPPTDRSLETQATPAPPVPAEEPPPPTKAESVSPLPDPQPLRLPDPPPPVISAATPDEESTPPSTKPKITQQQSPPSSAEAFETSVPFPKQSEQQPSPQMAAAKATNAASRYETIEKPYYLKRGKPEYPIEAKRLKQEGVVLLALFINERGRLDKIEVVQTSGSPLLDQAAIAAERRSRFRPAYRGRHAFACKAEVPYRFVLPK